MKYKLINLKPAVMSEDYFKRICKKVGVPTDDMNIEVTQEQFDRIVHNKDIQIARCNAELKKVYETQIVKADKASDDMKRKVGGKFDNQAKKEIKDAEADFKRRRDDIADIESSEGISRPHELYSGFGEYSSSVDRVSYEIKRTLSDYRDEKLNNLYKTYDAVKEQQAYSGLLSGIQRMYLESLARRIRRLQIKQSVALLKQNRIVNENARKYIEKRYRKFERMALLGVAEKKIKGL